MAGDEIKIAFLQEMVLDAAHDGGRVAIADFGNNDSDGKAALRTQRASKEVRTVFELLYRGEDFVFGFLRDRIGDGRPIDDQRNRGGGEPKILRQLFQTYRLAAHAYGRFSGRTRFSSRHERSLAQSASRSKRAWRQVGITPCIYEMRTRGFHWRQMDHDYASAATSDLKTASTTLAMSSIAPSMSSVRRARSMLAIAGH